MMSVGEAYKEVLKSISETARSCGRNPEEIELLAVSKTKPVDLIKEAAESGASVFGENRVSEAVEKREVLPPEIGIDFIGHLQSKKASKTVGKFRLIHSLDSLKLAAKLDRLNKEAGMVQKVLIELNISKEDAKHGYKSSDALMNDLNEILKMESISVEGFMTMAPFVQDETVIREVFSGCRELKEECEREFSYKFPRLSMGMSGDYKTAIQEGSTIVRVGSSIFGSR